MSPKTVVFSCLLALAAAQDTFDLEDAGRNFRCPEKNGLFPDPEQCDLYYACVDEVATAKYCEDGLLFDYSQVNHERCKLPSEMAGDCGDRIYVQEPAEDIADKEQCPHSNGFFNHPDESVCDKFVRCDKGRAFELGCAPPLVFDVKIGSCAFEAQVSAEARVCSDLDESGVKISKSVDGFTCPTERQVGPHGLETEHSIHPHPTDCQFFFACYYGKDPNKFGCTTGDVFDHETNICKKPEEVPECKCWYDCDAAQCDDCNSDCSCGPIEG